MACHRRSDCRLCGSTRLSRVLELAPTPPANALVPESALGRPQETFPLDVFFCGDCTHVQLLDVVDPSALFEHYVYVSGTSPVFVRHFEDYARDVRDRFAPAPGSLVVDIGSNDGTLLGFFKESGHAVLGIDPAGEIAAQATRNGIETWPEFVTPALARKIKEARGGAGVVTANNVFAHADDLRGMAEGIRALLADDGVFVFEVSYLADVYEKTLFDTIYHEHLAYHTVKPLRRFLQTVGLEMIEAFRTDSHGGSLRGVAQILGGPRPVGASVEERIGLEKRLGLDRAETLVSFAASIDALKAELGRLLRGLKDDGKTIAGFGAPAKATTLMHHFGIGPETIDFIIDDSPLKQGLYSPGFHIPIVPAEALYERKPDYALILAWNFARPIIDAHAAYSKAGGRFIVPLPKIEII